MFVAIQILSLVFDVLLILADGASCESGLFGECKVDSINLSQDASVAATPVRSGALSVARLNLLDLYRQHGTSSEIKKECGKAWQHALNDLVESLGVNGSMKLVAEKHARSDTTSRKLTRASKCWDGRAGGLSWADCCANVHGLQGNPACFADSSLPGFVECCAFAEGSESFLKIPALMEVRIMLGLPTGRLLTLEQDGFLRPFDVATVLWPGGYLLARWAGSPERCQWWPGRRVLELGAGTGAAGIAAAGCGASVVSTDLPEYALLLIASNAVLNGVEIEVHRLDWHNDTEVNAIKNMGPFDAIIGASLFYEKWYPRLWWLLEELAFPRQGKNSNDQPLIALSHMTGSLARPPHGSALIEESRIHGERFGMGRPDRGDAYAESDFEIVMLRSTSL